MEKILAGLEKEPVEKPLTANLAQMLQCRLLLQIAKTLDAIEKKLEPAQPISSHRSLRVY